MNKRSRRILAVKCVLTVSLVAFILCVWPGYLFHEEYVSRTFCDRYEPSEILLPGDAATQYFVPQRSFLAGIEFMVHFKEAYTGSGTVRFVLCEESGREIFSQDIILEQMESDEYYKVEIRERLKEGAVYYWTLVSPDDERAELQVMYTGHMADQAPENTLFLMNDEQYGETSQTVSQYTYFIHPDKVIIIGGYWMGAVLVYLVGMDIATRIFGREKDNAVTV